MYVYILVCMHALGVLLCVLCVFAHMRKLNFSLFHRILRVEEVVTKLAHMLLR